MPKSHATLLEVRALARSSAGRSQLLHPVSFSICENNLIICQGNSGSGKTVLLRGIAKLDDHQGDVLWNGESVVNEQIPLFRTQVMYLPQRPMMPDGTVREALQEPFGWHAHREKRYDEAIAKAYFSSLSKSNDFFDAKNSNLSEGESQIVAIVRAMLLTPTVLLLDEPTSALDPELTIRFERLVLDWLDQSPRRAILWVTHLQPQANRLATRKFHVDTGTVSIDV